MSIVLTVAPQINTVLGGSTLVSYDHVVLSPINFNQEANSINATVRLTSTADPTMDVIQGRLVIDLSAGTLLFAIEQLDIVRKMNLSGGQITAAGLIMSNAADALEAGILDLGVAAGIQATGA